RVGTLAVSTGVARVTPGRGVAATSVVSKITPTGSASFDLGDNDLVIDYSGTSPLTSITALLTSGYNAGAWTGVGINSSVAAANASAMHKPALGYAEATEIFSTFPAAFSGQSVDSTAVLIRYTAYGDANLDGSVDTVDFNALASNFSQSGKRWVQGDFNYDSV